MKKLLYLTDYFNLPSGYGRIAKEALKELSKDYEVVTFPYNIGSYRIHDSRLVAFIESIAKDIFPLRIGDLPDYSDFIYGLIKNYEPDIVLCMQDWEIIARDVDKSIRDFKDKIAWVSWGLLDSYPLDVKYRNLISNFDCLIGFNHSYVEFMEKYAPRIRKEIVYPFISSSIRRAERRDIEIFKAIKGLGGKKICLFVGKNQSRKNIAMIFRVFGKVVKELSDEKLHLHLLSSSTNEGGYDFGKLALYYGLDLNQVSSLSGDVYVTDEELNMWYNCADVVLLPSLGEGIGLPLLESYRVGTPFVGVNSFAQRDYAVLLNSHLLYMVEPVSYLSDNSGSIWSLISDENFKESWMRALNIVKKEEEVKLPLEFENNGVRLRQVLNEVLKNKNSMVIDDAFSIYCDNLVPAV